MFGDNRLPDAALMENSLMLQLWRRIGNAMNLLNNGRIQGSSAPDWVTNTAQSGGLETGQYNVAMFIGSSLPKSNPQNNTFVPVNGATSFKKYTGWTIVGHSLGGGLASAAAGVCSRARLTGQEPIGNRVDTFNAAGLHQNTVPTFLRNLNLNGQVVPARILRQRLSRIVAYRTEADELTKLQEEDWIGIHTPRAAGNQYWLEDSEDAENTGSLEEEWPGHTMQSVIQGLCVDAIGRHLERNYIIDRRDGICLRGNRNQTVTGTIRIGTTPYAY